MNLVKTLSISLFIFAALAVKASDSNVFNTTKADVNYTVFIIHSDVETKITEIRARIDSLKNILNTKKEEVAYADKQADIQKMLLQLQEFSDQIDLVEASQLSDGDKMMELVFWPIQIHWLYSSVMTLRPVMMVAILRSLRRPVGIRLSM